MEEFDPPIEISAKTKILGYGYAHSKISLIFYEAPS
jgi:hypothetical protein